jgi:hypothetical protein
VETRNKLTGIAVESVVALTVILKNPLLLIIEWLTIDRAILRSHRRNCSVLVGVMPNLDCSDASIRIQLAAQVERFVDRLDKTVSMKPILPEESGTLLRCTRS